MATTTEIVAAPKELDAGMMVRRALFLVLLISITYYYLGIDFKGLSHPKGMDQAQIARQIASGRSFTTQCIRPLAFRQVETEMKESDPTSVPAFAGGIPDTYHSPLNPILNSILLGMARGSWGFGESQVLYTPDIMITGVSMVMLLASIGVTYLLVSRIFDARIGGVTALLMLLCELLWRFSQSGLPQMLMLFLFSFGTYFLYKAIENKQAGRPVYLWMGLTGGFFGLLALAHWLAVWPFVGLALFAAFYFQPRGIQVAILAGVFLLITIWWPFLNNARYTGNPLGAGLYLFYSGMNGTEDDIFRDLEVTTRMDFNGFTTKVVTTAVGQISNLYAYFGGIVAAPLFFLALLHPFRRREIADFRWCILLMWLFAVVGMTFFGIKTRVEEETDPNNLHVLFIPLMTGYGLAFLSVLWNRLNLPLQIPIVRNGHFILAVIVSCIPTLMHIPLRIVQNMQGQAALKVHFPEYIPRALAEMASSIKPNQAVVTNIPWAVAWYMDRPAIWLPKDQAQLAEFQRMGKDRGQPVGGILFSHSLTNEHALDHRYADWRNYLLFPPIQRLLGSTGNKALMEAVATSIQTDLPIKNFAPTGAADEYNVYLFVTEERVTRPENEPSGSGSQ